ncbi:Hint domain-containing protein [Thioclava sp. GXIMD4216]|uniref:Hint domain-containing protein n=1 Tax=Thioclava litoralis TaxID=3076557 RepID=A0ABZ1E217_9RHOB|nr:Hint domain-containing protein [Thioclava sp. FTW29]
MLRSGIDTRPSLRQMVPVPQDGRTEGICAGTLILTELGWRTVESLQAGDAVMTFDHGYRPVRKIARGLSLAGGADCPDHGHVMHVPVAALGNHNPMVLQPDQHVMIESDLAEEAFGDPFVLVPAAALEGYRGISAAQSAQRLSVYTVQFADDEVIYVNGAGLVHCGGLSKIGLEQMIGDSLPSYISLPVLAARAVVDALKEADEQSALLA